MKNPSVSGEIARFQKICFVVFMQTFWILLLWSVQVMVYDLLNSSSAYNDLLQYYENQGNNVVFNILFLAHQIYFWWLVRVTLVAAWWLFAPKFWEVVGTYESLFCSKMNAASVVVTCEVVGTLNHYKKVKNKFELCALRGGGDIKTFRLSLAP